MAEGATKARAATIIVNGKRIILTAPKKAN